MRKILLLLVIILVITGCSKQDDFSDDINQQEEIVNTVLDYNEFLLVDENHDVIIESYVQGIQYYKDGVASLYLQDQKGVYYIKNVSISKDDISKMVDNLLDDSLYCGLANGRKVHVEGKKTGQNVIDNAVITVIDGVNKLLVPAIDITSLLDEDLFEYMDRKVKLSEMVVDYINDADGSYSTYIYKVDASGTKTDDIYMNLSKDGNNYLFVIDVQLLQQDNNVFNTLNNLKAGDIIDVDVFLYDDENTDYHIVNIIAENEE